MDVAYVAFVEYCKERSLIGGESSLILKGCANGRYALKPDIVTVGLSYRTMVFNKVSWQQLPYMKALSVVLVVLVTASVAASVIVFDVYRVGHCRNGAGCLFPYCRGFHTSFDGDDGKTARHRGSGGHM